jgi:Asp-tRNA(Asn)/Glu-tRNA(Gln) amidotransferase A subunit family amidase
MVDARYGQISPVFWPISLLVQAYRNRQLSPVEVAREAIERIERYDPQLRAFLTRLDDLALSQAAVAEKAYRSGSGLVLSGVPVSIKDTFDLAGARTTYGSQFHRDNVSARDSGAVKRLRAAGAVFIGKANTAEFGQSATTDNTLADDACNPWDITRTPGGSSGGGAASVAAGLATVALAADGGGSIRIPGAFTGLFGLKPTHGACKNEYGLAAMSDFVCPGPLARCVDDGRLMLEVLTGRNYPRKVTRKGLRIAWCPNPENRPVDPGVAEVVAGAVALLSELGHEVVETELPLTGWKDVFGPLVLDEERRERGHLLERPDGQLTDYERVTLEAGLGVTQDEIDRARRGHQEYIARLDNFMDGIDAIVTPATATCAFRLGQRPTQIDGRPVSELWGAVPFTSPFNVSGQPAADLPCGVVDGLPVAMQIVTRRNHEQLLLDLCEDMEMAIGFDLSPLWLRWPQLRHGLKEAL